MSSQNNVRAFVEVTAFAVMLFAVPFGYYYKRGSLIETQNKIYYKMFGINQEHLDTFKRKIAEQERLDREDAERRRDQDDDGK